MYITKKSYEDLGDCSHCVHGYEASGVDFEI